MAWICGTKWGWCEKVKSPHRCKTLAYKARDHDHVCEHCGAVRKNT